MRSWLVLAIALSGCASTVPSGDAPVETCDGSVHEATLFLDAGHALVNTTPAAGSVFSNGFEEAFLVDEMAEWTSGAWTHPARLVGNATLEYWVRNDGTPAPVVVGGQPGEAYHWFNQFGSDRGFVPAYGREYATAAPAPGSVDHYIETIALPPGGLHVESGGHLRLLLTSLVVDAAQRGQHILVGGDTPSAVSFTWHCMAHLAWDEVAAATRDINIQAHQGLITGAIPTTAGTNYVDVAFTLLPETQRLTVSLQQGVDQNPLKDDMDLTILDATGRAVTSIGSPYADESGTLYAANLAAMMPPGDYVVRVDSYSGYAYRGTLSITQDVAVLA